MSAKTYHDGILRERSKVWPEVMTQTWDHAEAPAAGLDVVHEDHRPWLHAQPEAADVRLPLTLQALFVPGPVGKGPG